MKITPKNLIYHELIGLPAKVVESTDPSLVGIEGNVTDETRNMVTIEHDGKEKKVAKANASFVFALPDAKVKVDGRLLVSQPENRIRG